MIEHPSVLDRFGVEPADWCKKINQSVRRREEESQYLSRGFAHEDGVDGLQPCCVIPRTSLVLRPAVVGHTRLHAASEP